MVRIDFSPGILYFRVLLHKAGWYGTKFEKTRICCVGRSMVFRNLSNPTCLYRRLLMNIAADVLPGREAGFRFADKGCPE
jgi:hypothetical protein